MKTTISEFRERLDRRIQEELDAKTAQARKVQETTVNDLDEEIGRDSDGNRNCELLAEYLCAAYQAYAAGISLSYAHKRYTAKGASIPNFWVGLAQRLEQHMVNKLSQMGKSDALISGKVN